MDGSLYRRVTKVLFAVIVLAATFTPKAHCQCSFPPDSVGTPMSYAFEPIVSSGGLLLRVTLEFQGGHTGAAELYLPSDWAGQTHLDGQPHNIRAISSDAAILDTDRPDVKRVRFPADKPVKISFDIVKDWEGVFEHPKEFRGVLEPTFFEFTTHNGLVHPELSPTAVVSVHFDWQKLPQEWTLETSFGTADRCQSFTGLWNQASNALFAGGDFRVHRAKVRGQPLVVAIHGKWSFTDEEAVGRIQRILAEEREFWHDDDFPYYLVTLVPFDVQSGSSDGSAFTNAFWLFLPSGERFSYNANYLLAHEGFHAWNPLKMGPERKPVASEKWFSEGFTVYYGDVLLLRSGLLSLPDYIEKINRRIRDYESSPVKNLSNNELAARYDENTVNELPHVRGPIIALWLDAAIRARSNNSSSLDDVMRALMRESSARPASELTSQRVLGTATRYLDRRTRKMLSSFLEVGLTIPLPDLPKNRCVHLLREQVSLFDLGFDPDTLRSKNMISGVREDSEAFKAGIRNGQEVLGMSIHWGDVSQPVKLTVRSIRGQETIAYFPKGRAVSIGQYHLDAEARGSTPEQCTFP